MLEPPTSNTFDQFACCKTCITEVHSEQEQLFFQPDLLVNSSNLALVQVHIKMFWTFACSSDEWQVDICCSGT